MVGVNSASAFQSFGNNFIWSTSSDMSMDSEDQESSMDDESSDDSSEDEDSDQTMDDNSEANEDLTFDTDGNVGANAEVNGDITAAKNLSIGANATVNGNLVVAGNLTIGANAEINGNVKVLWNIAIGANAEVNGTIYGYKSVTASATVGTSGKLKSAGLFTAGASYDGEWKLYAFGGKKFLAAAEFADNKEKGVLGKLDAYLLIDISDEDFAQVKAIASKYDADIAAIVAELKKARAQVLALNTKIKLAPSEEEKTTLTSDLSAAQAKVDALKAQGKSLIEKLIIETENYIETEEFDQKGVNFYLKNEELAKLDLNQAVAKDVVTTVKDKVEKIENRMETKNSSSVVVAQKNEKLKATMKALLEKKLAKYDTEKRNKMYDVLLGKLDKMIEKVESEKMKNTLTVLKEVVLELQDDSSVEADIDNLLNDSDEAPVSQTTTETSTSTQTGTDATQSTWESTQTTNETTTSTSTQTN